MKEHLGGAIEEWPAVGEPCDHCGKRIPKFLELDPKVDSEATQLVMQVSNPEAVGLIQSATGCPLAWAELWVEHAFGTLPKQLKGPPCPTCGKKLVVKGAKTCPHCGSDWRSRTLKRPL